MTEFTKKTIQIVGPYYTNFSYARINRALALQLEKIQNEYEIKLYCDPESIDYNPSDIDLDKKPELKPLVRRERIETDIAIYNNFPKSLTSSNNLESLPGKIKIGYFVWEESVYPEAWVKEINQNLHGVMVGSHFCKEILRRSGVKLPMQVVHMTIDNAQQVEGDSTFPIETNKKFKFLNISTAKARKGIDVLLKAYFEEFTNKDDVTLILKTSPGPDNLTDQLINSLKTENSPEVIHINKSDFTEEDIRNLHRSVDCEVYPTRAEGFGLPVLEAMAQGTPVIVTNYSAVLDFCNPDNAYLIDYKLEYAKDSELVNVGAKWAEPDKDHLKKLMRNIFTKGKNSNEVQQKIKMGKIAAQKLTWGNSAKTALEFIKEIEVIAESKKRNLAILTPMNDEGGISRYSKDLYKTIESSFNKTFYIANKDIADRSEKDEDNIVRLWEMGDNNLDKVVEFLKDNNVDLLHIQYHSGSFYTVEALNKLIKDVKDIGVKVFVTLHSMKSDSFNFIQDIQNLNIADKVLILNKNDLEYASKTLQNVQLFRIPNILYKNRNKEALKNKLGLSQYNPVIATHGLTNTNKNLPQLIQATAELKKEYPNLLLLLLSAVSSNNMHANTIYNECIELIEKNNLSDSAVYVRDFLSEEMVEVLIQAADVIVYNYSEVGESGSAAVSKALASLNPVITTDIKVFSDFENEIFKMRDTSIESIVTNVKRVLENKALAKDLVSSTQKFLDNYNYEVMAKKLLKIYTNS
jgi:glycosyltransferase involved in cell wall biosynthesis